MKPSEIRFRYTSNVSTLYDIRCDAQNAVLVLGDPDSAAYEWVIMRDNDVTTHSDVAYGSAEIALRDGLIELLGPPQSD